MQERFKATVCGVGFTATLEPYPLDLVMPFGTSHSVTTSRTNALVSVTVDGLTGYGECGLPPKKRACTLGNASDL